MKRIGYSGHYGIARIYFLGALGTIVEWYDFAIYGHFSSVFARVFFVNKSPWLSLALVYSIFFASYLARPLGALIYGYIGDNLGRRTALLFSIGMMTISMLIMMLLPTWHTIGNVAPVLLLIFRIMQGLSAGGETTGAFVYVLESVNQKRYGLYGSMTWAMISCGILLGSGMVALFSGVLSDAQLLAWGWRLAYLIGAILGMVIFFLRAFMPESVAFAQAKQNQQESDDEDKPSLLTEILFNYKSTVLMIVAFAALSASSSYFTFFYFPQYVHHYWHVKLSSVMTSNTAFAAIIIVAKMLFGYLSDFVGKRRVMVFTALCFLFFSYPIIDLVSSSALNALIIAPFLLTVLVAMYEAPMPGVMIELAPLRIRYTLVALGYNISFAIFGGATMLISSLLIHWFHTLLAPAYYLMAMAALSLIALLLLRRWRAA